MIFETFVCSSFLILVSREHVVGGRGLYGGLSVRGQRKALLGGQRFECGYGMVKVECGVNRLVIV